MVWSLHGIMNQFFVGKWCWVHDMRIMMVGTYYIYVGSCVEGNFLCFPYFYKVSKPQNFIVFFPICWSGFEVFTTVCSLKFMWVGHYSIYKPFKPQNGFFSCTSAYGLQGRKGGVFYFLGLYIFHVHKQV